MREPRTNPRPIEEPGAGAWVDYLGGGYHQEPFQNPDDVMHKSLAQTVQGQKKFGSETDHTTFEADGTLKMVGDAKVWNDWNLVRDFTPLAGAGVPVRNALVGGIVKDQFAVNDALQFQSVELLHDWAEGSDVEVHVHWALGATNDATVRGVKWQVEYTICNPVEAGGSPTAFSTSTTASQEFAVPAGQADRSHRVGTIVVIPGTGLKVGAHLEMVLKRIAATNPAPAADPFLISFGVHYQSDTLGSRETFIK
jgi:hypothetical protein